MAKDGLRFLGDPTSPVNYTCNLLDKDNGTFQYIQYMFDRTNRMFRYHNLPDTIPEPIFEYMLQVYGSVAIIEHQGDLYAMRANFGGPPDPYYRPSQCVIANPALALTDTYRIVNHLPPFDKTVWNSYPPAVRVLNDTQIMGLLPLFSRYASQMTENDISIRCAQINLRQQSIICADSGPELESANAYMKNLEAGGLSAIGRRPFLEGITVTNAGSGQSNLIFQLLELQQYLKASWYNEIGLNSNFNMKKQYQSAEEINSSADIMLPLIDNMFECRRQAIDFINDFFGTDIKIEKDSAWEKKQLQSELSIIPEGGNVPLEEDDFEKEDETIQEERDSNDEFSQQDSTEPDTDSDDENDGNGNDNAQNQNSENEEDDEDEPKQKD